MTKPEDIPQDVWDVAFKAMPPPNQMNYGESPYSMTLHLGFARAIMAEREACALTADAEAANPFNDWARGIAQRIAHNIRNRGAE